MKKYKLYKVDLNNPENVDKNGCKTYKACGLSDSELYYILGEAGNTNHYIVFSLSNGLALPGFWHLERFRLATEEEI